MQLTKDQLERILCLYQGFGWEPGMVPPEVAAVDDAGGGHKLEVRLGGYSIYIDHMGHVVAPVTSDGAPDLGSRPS
jgi:hypothetical protein